MPNKIQICHRLSFFLHHAISYDITQYHMTSHISIWHHTMWHHITQYHMCSHISTLWHHIASCVKSATAGTFPFPNIAATNIPPDPPPPPHPCTDCIAHTVKQGGRKPSPDWKIKHSSESHHGIHTITWRVTKWL